MVLKKNTQQPSCERTSESLIIASDPAELSSTLHVVHERLLHPQTTQQVFADTFRLNSLTRALLNRTMQIGQERSTSLIYAERSLAVFELGIVAMLACSDFNMLIKERFYASLEYERNLWSQRVWLLRLAQERDTGETTRYPLGFIQTQDE
jgi:hypothetical protein